MRMYSGSITAVTTYSTLNKLQVFHMNIYCIRWEVASPSVKKFSESTGVTQCT